MSKEINNITEKKIAEEQSANQENLPYHQQVEEYGEGHIQARHGKINGWLMLVYSILFVWSIYYGYVYWGGLGPGLDYEKKSTPTGYYQKIYK